MHPALDVVDDTLYCAVTTRDKEKRPTLAIITSKGEIYNREEWAAQMIERGLQPIADVVLDPKVRWNIKGMRELNNRTLKKPSWKEVYDAIYGAYDQRLVTDESYIMLSVLHSMLTYFHALFEKLPMLHLLGPSDSGKTRLATIKSKVDFNANINAHITLTLIHKSESTQKNRIIMGSTTAERKHHPYGCVFRPKPLVESFYAQYLWRTLLLFGESLPSHGDGQDFQDSTFVYKCQI